MTEQELSQQIDAIKTGPALSHKRKVTLGELIGMMARHEPNHLAQIERLKQSAAAQARTA